MSRAKMLRAERHNAVRMLVVELERQPRNKLRVGQAKWRLRYTDTRIDDYLDTLEQTADGYKVKTSAEPSA